jgi:hypothetical protein
VHVSNHACITGKEYGKRGATFLLLESDTSDVFGYVHVNGIDILDSGIPRGYASEWYPLVATTSTNMVNLSFITEPSERTDFKAARFHIAVSNLMKGKPTDGSCRVMLRFFTETANSNGRWFTQSIRCHVLYVLNIVMDISCIVILLTIFSLCKAWYQAAVKSMASLL